MQFVLGCGLGVIPNNLHFLFQGLNAMMINLMSQELQLGDTKLTLSWIDNDTMPTDSFKDQS